MHCAGWGLAAGHQPGRVPGTATSSADMGKPDLDVDAAHGYFAARCFNLAWKGIDAATRTPEDAANMLSAAHASYWHWTQHPKCTAQNRSVGNWQLSRAYALLGHAALSTTYAERALEDSLAAALPPYFTGYAYEALARAARVSGEAAACSRYVKLARASAERVESDESRRLLLADLDELDHDVLT